MEDLDRIRNAYNLSGPKFNGASIVLADVTSKVISKAATYLTIVSRQEVNIDMRKM